MDQWLDWSAFGFLALLTFLDGLRRVPAGALVLRRIGTGKWAVVELREGYRMVSWWPPLTATLILDFAGRTDGAEAGRADGLAANLRKVRRRVLTLQVLGLLGLSALVVMVPIGIRWWGGMGFLLSLLLVLFLSWVITGFSFYFSRDLGLTTRQRLMFALPRLNPFAAPAAGEAFLERALRSSEPVAVARGLMAGEDFTQWIRPLAYDVVESHEAERGEDLLKVIGHKQLKEIITNRPARVEASSPWCPRCGSEFGSASTECPACEIPLKT